MDRVKNVLKTCLIGAVLLSPWLAKAADRDDISAKLAAAKAGDVVILEARTYQAGDLLLPEGVSLRGAGFDKTMINAAGFKNGLSIKGGKGATVSDLSVSNAQVNGITVSGSSGVTLSRVRLIGNLTGLLFEKVENGRIENAVIAGNRTGVILSGNSRTVLVNCSLVNNTVIALTVSGNKNLTVFNNLFVNSPTGIYVAKNNEALVLDHNLYLASFLGKLEGEAMRTSLAGWQRLSGWDAHSLSLPVDFADAAKSDYRPASSLFWAPSLATTSDWGVDELNVVAAPKTDILGNKRSGAADLGAFEAALPVTRKADGSFEITSDNGVKSAGLYDSRGVQVATLFQNLPLHKGKHDFWLPARDNWNRPLPVGQYEVRVVESQLNNKYLGLAGNFGASSDRLDNCSWPEEMFAFDAQDRLYILQNSFENGMGIRAFDAEYKTPRWMMPGGGNNVGAAVDATDLYYLQRTGEGKHNLRKINLETGRIDPIAPGEHNRFYLERFSKETYGMALLNGRLFISDPTAGKIFVADAADPKFTASFDIAGALSVTADTRNGLLWVINAEGNLLALDPVSGAVKATAAPVTGIRRISANNGRLAALSPATGKIHVFDLSDPGHLKPIQTIGTGDGPYGPQKPDRFWFQASDRKPAKMHVAINSKGEVAVVDAPRISFWGADGSLKKQGLGFWGQHNYLGRFAGDTDVRIWGINGDYSIKMDCKNKKWAPDSNWRLPAYEFVIRAPRNFFSVGGNNFGVYQVALGDPGKTADGRLQTKSPIDPKQQMQGLLVVRFDACNAVPVTLYYRDSVRKTLVEQHDSNHDGMIDANDEVTEIRLADGKAVGIPWDRYGGLPWDDSGDLVFTSPPRDGTTGCLVKMSGLDASKTWPVYNWVSPEIIPCTFDGKTSKMVSPFDYKTGETLTRRTVQLARLSDGGYAGSIWLTTSGGMGLGNGCGTDIAGFGKDGLLRWIFKLNHLEGSEGVQSVPEYNLVLGMTTKQCDYMAMDNDGLGLGILSMPPEARWKGMWSDHAQQQQAWVGNDGKPYYILGDYCVNAFHWFEITGADQVKRQRVAVSIDEAKAATLAALPGLPPVKAPELPKTRITIRRLEKPLTIDGDLLKWRTAGIAPAAIVTPETGTANILGPKDCSAIIRLAYHGTDLYVQTLVFDDLITMHQTFQNMYQQDGIEMGINGFMQGFKFNVSITTDKGSTVFRNKFVAAKADRLYTNEQIPRSIRILDSANDVEERQLVEAIYGVDLRDSKVIVTEFKLALTPEVALDGDPKLIETVGPGGSFWIGFMINDNDLPGGDVQKYLVWPATYGTFNVKESGALATFE